MAAPTITNISYPASVSLYDKYEISFDVTTVASNLYWPYDINTPSPIAPGIGITVNGLFSNDNWLTTATRPGFVYQDYFVPTYNSLYTSDPVIPTGIIDWRIRFAPNTVGTWAFKISTEDALGAITYPNVGDVGFICASSIPGTAYSHGPVRISPTDYRYFELTDTTPLVGPGINDSMMANIDRRVVASYYQNHANNGIKIIRHWMNYRGGIDLYGYYGNTWAMISITPSIGGGKTGDFYSLYANAGYYRYQTFVAEPSVMYKLQVAAASASIAGGSGQIRIGPAGSGYSAVCSLIGNNSWANYIGTWQNNATRRSVYIEVRNSNSSFGTLYADEFLLQSYSGGTWSVNLLNQPDFDTQNYINLNEAWKLDQYFQSAKDYGVYLKCIVTDKGDPILGSINMDGNITSRSDTNYYSYSPVGTHIHPSRWWQQSAWRYIAGRWGGYTSVHSWELCNEGDPFNGNHWNLANAFANYIHSIDSNYLSSTSFWDSIPMEFWKNSECDFLDDHIYPGPVLTDGYTPGEGSIYYDFKYFTNLLPWENNNYKISIATNVSHSGNNSLLIESKAPQDSAFTSKYYLAGVNPTHSYDISFWAKSDNTNVSSNSGLSWNKPGLFMVWSKARHENDFQGDTYIYADIGTYDWTYYIATGIFPASQGNDAGAGFDVNSICLYTRSSNRIGATSSFWIDDIKVKDNITGENIYPFGNFENNERIDYDSSLFIEKIGFLEKSYCDRINKPAIIGECGFHGTNQYGSPYKGQIWTGNDSQNPELINDLNGLSYKKWIWGHTTPYYTTGLLWWFENLDTNNLWNLFKSYQNFMSGIYISNGNYSDICASVSNNNLKAIGQSDLINNKAHIWVNNKPYTWKSEVNASYSPATWNPAVTYTTNNTCGYNIPIHMYQAVASNIGMVVASTTWWTDLGEWNATQNPAVPSAVSGNVIIPSLVAGTYTVETWDTSLGTIIGTQYLVANSPLIIPVVDLVSDIAYKIYPAQSEAPSIGNLYNIDISINPPAMSWEHGKTTNVYLNYFNMSVTGTHNCGIDISVPAYTTYVTHSASISGGSYNSTLNNIYWNIITSDVEYIGTKNFQVTVN